MVKVVRTDEDKFILAFKDLIEAYSHELLNQHKDSDEVTTIDNLMSSQRNGSCTLKKEVKHADSSLLELRFESFMSTYENTKFNLGLLPYDKVTSLVFFETPEDIQNIFAEALLKKGEVYYANRTLKDDPSLEMHKEGFYKIIRHINLALIQKDIISSKKIDQIIELERKNMELNKQYQQLKADAEKQIDEIKTEAKKQYDSLKVDFTKQYESMYIYSWNICSNSNGGVWCYSGFY